MERLAGKYIFDPELTSGKMIFLSGPRQVGKTTFARAWLASGGFADTYFNWDDPAVPLAYRKNPLYFRNAIDERYSGSSVPIVFDEMHKHVGWRNVLKGLYDVNRERIRLLVTGSARLGVQRKSGDSLVGRYFLYQMLPLGLPEVTGDFSPVLFSDESLSDGPKLAGMARAAPGGAAEEGLDLLLRFSGYPEPFLKGSERFHRRWQRDYRSLVTREDVRDLSRITDIRGMETLVEMLPSKVTSPLSIPSLAGDLGRKYDTVKNWLNILEGLYLVFSLLPWHADILRTIRKESKLYFFDWTLVPEGEKRFENLVAVSLFRMAARFTETGQGDFQVRYLRDKEKREVDFILAKDNRPVALFEAKESETGIGRSGLYFCRKLNVPLYQIVRRAVKVEAFPENCFVIPAANFLMLAG